MGLWVKFSKKLPWWKKIPSLFTLSTCSEIFILMLSKIFPTLKHKASFVLNIRESAALWFAWFCAQWSLTVLCWPGLKAVIAFQLEYRQSRLFLKNNTHTIALAKSEWKFHKNFKCTLVFFFFFLNQESFAYNLKISMRI